MIPDSDNKSRSSADAASQAALVRTIDISNGVFTYMMLTFPCPVLFSRWLV